jgi:hypothetical protein
MPQRQLNDGFSDKEYNTEMFPWRTIFPRKRGAERYLLLLLVQRYTQEWDGGGREEDGPVKG